MWTTGIIAKVLGLKDPKNNQKVGKFSFDTRTLEKGDCFIALKGERDGHEFIKSAKGAVCTVGERDADFIVPDSLEALRKLAIYARDNCFSSKIAITGSVGKTTTKSFLDQILGKLCNTMASEKSFNNHIGVPLTMTKLSSAVDIGIFELGTNHPGEIKELSDLLQPNVAIITNVSGSHIGHYPDGIEGIIREKGSIVSGLEEGTLIVSRDSEYYDRFKDLYSHVMTFGWHEESDIRLLSIGEKIFIKIGAESFAYEVPFTEEHHIYNTLPVWCILRLFGMSYAKAIMHFKNLQIPEGRGAMHEVEIEEGKKVTIIDDAYNAPFEGFKASLKHLSQFKNRKVAILGDMGELGEYALQYHKAVLDLAKEQGIDLIIPCGPTFAQLMGQAVVERSQITNHLQDGDFVLFKGSNASGLHRVVSQFLKKAS